MFKINSHLLKNIPRAWAQENAGRVNLGTYYSFIQRVFMNDIN